MLRPAAFAVLLTAAPAFAQQEQPRPEGIDDPRRNQRIQRIVHEDAGARIQELRVGGQTEAIEVQPKGDLPAYQVEPGHLSRTRPGDQRNGLSGAGGQRSWNVFRF
ncbi:MAG TPA: hypothetical protein VEA40_25890 [Ramlibacter sp.]|nr:hypothetical protein [Ramlibacter sp.]